MRVLSHDVRVAETTQVCGLDIAVARTRPSPRASSTCAITHRIAHVLRAVRVDDTRPDFGLLSLHAALRLCAVPAPRATMPLATREDA